jgi:FAD/FMN-containing dehydrogenase
MWGCVISEDFATSVKRAVEELRERIGGPVLLPGDAGYEGARAVWNDAVDHRPALIVRCGSTQDVQAAVRAARSHQLPVSVRVGGHDWLGRSVRSDGLVVDLTGLRGVEVDPQAQVATVAGGALSGDLAQAAAGHGLAAVLGTVSVVGVAGLTMAGGYSPLSPRYGLALDNLLAVEVVLADGSVLVADESRNTDLFWAVRGGGGNFGVVTTMQIRLHRVPSVLSGPIVFPWAQAESVLRGHAELAASAPDELGMVGGIVPGPDGDPVVALTPVWCGDPAEGEQLMAEVAALGDPLVEQVRPMPFHETFAAGDARAANRGHYAMRTRSLSELGPDPVAALVAAGSERTSPFSVVTWQFMRGAPTRVPVDATAFLQRRDHFMLQIIPGWDVADSADRHVAWAEELTRALAPHSLPGGYPNLLGPEMREQTAHAYGTNLPRLKQVKERYDPDGIFTATPIPA